MNLIRLIYCSFFLLFSCDSLKTIQLYDFVVEEEDPVAAFANKDIFIDSKESRVWGVKQNDCKSISFDTINNSIGSDHLHLKWNDQKGCKYLGFGFAWGNFKGKNLTPIINQAAIEFKIRIDSGVINKVPMFFSLVDYSEKQCFSKINILGIEGQIIDQKWRKVIIPLSTFKYQKKGVNISNIKELRIQLQRKGDVHIDDLKIVPHVHNYGFAQSHFSNSFSSFPIPLGKEKKYWWGVNEMYSDNLKFTTNSSFLNKSYQPSNDSLIVLPELEVSLSLSVNYDKNADDYKWNNFGFPLNKWEYADLSAIYTTSAIHFKIRGSKVPKMQVNLGSYMGKIKRINKIIESVNIVELNEDLYSVYVPVKSFGNYDQLDWTKIKDIKFKFLESTNIEIGDFKIVEFRGNPNYPNKWRGI